jgi:hypothetical protein
MNMNKMSNRDKLILNHETIKASAAFAKDAWYSFVWEMTSRAKALYDELVLGTPQMTPTELGTLLRTITSGQPLYAIDITPRGEKLAFLAFAYVLRKDEAQIREWAETAMLLHFPREDIFDLMLSLHFGLTPTAFTKETYELAQHHFVRWLGEFPPDELAATAVEFDGKRYLVHTAHVRPDQPPVFTVEGPDGFRQTWAQKMDCIAAAMDHARDGTVVSVHDEG